MLAIYNIVVWAVFVLSLILADLTDIQSVIIMNVVSNLCYLVIFNNILKRNRRSVDSKVTANGLAGARLTSVVISAFCTFPILKHASRQILLFLIVVLCIFLMLKFRCIKCYFKENTFDIWGWIAKNAIIISLEAIVILIISVYDIGYADCVYGKDVFLELLWMFWIEALTVPRNSLLAILSTKAYMYRDAADPGNRYLP